MNIKKWFIGDKTEILLARDKALSDEERQQFEIGLKRSRMDRERIEALLENPDSTGPSGTVIADIFSGRTMKREPR